MKAACIGYSKSIITDHILGVYRQFIPSGYEVLVSFVKICFELFQIKCYQLE